MLICMKPTRKQLNALRKRISDQYAKSNLSKADIGRLANVHPSQVGRICTGNFKTISNNVVQVCKILKVKAPKLDEEANIDTEWAKANASLRRIWDQTPEGAVMIRRMLDAVADLRASQPTDDPEPLA